jgi:hypothetical protein
MGVKECGRAGCENIMCDRLIDGHTYLCSDCWSELLRVKETWPKEMMGGEVRKRIDEFLESKPRSYDLVNTDEEFERLVGS